MTFKFKAVINGQEQEVELDQPPAGFIAESQHQTILQNEIQRRVTGAKQDARAELLADEAFRTEALGQWGIDPNAKGKGGQLSAEELQKLRDTLTKELVDPLRQENDGLKKRVSGLTTAQLKAEILTAAGKAGVKKSLMTPPVEGADAPIVSMMLGLFGLDEKTNSWAIKQGEGFAYSAKATAERPYKGAEEFFTEWAGNKSNADFLEAPPKQGGPGMGAGSGGQAVSISRTQARDHSAFKAAEAQAKERGVALQITDD